MYELENLGTYDIEKALKLRRLNKHFYGKNVKMRLYGRGKRIFTKDGLIANFGHDLPLKFAKKAIVYRELKVSKDNMIELEIKSFFEEE